MRFRDQVSEIDQWGFIVDGMPVPRTSKTVTIKALRINMMVDLAKIAVFLEQATSDEKHVSLETSFVAEYESIKDDSEHGLYHILCLLHSWNIDSKNLSTKQFNELKKLKVPAVHNRAIRDLRDFVVLRDMSRIISRLIYDLNRN